jgi:tetratricopeptide (TPR) repeat protein
MSTPVIGALAATIQTEAPNIAEAYLKLKQNILKDVGGAAGAVWPNLLTFEASGLRRQKRWIDASKKFEAAGQYYSAMYCLHKAIEVNEGFASDNFRTLSYLYHKVGRHERAKRYAGYADYRLAKENVSTAKKYLKERGIKKDMREFSKEVGTMVYDDHETFNKNLEEYVRIETAKAGPRPSDGLLCRK